MVRDVVCLLLVRRCCSLSRQATGAHTVPMFKHSLAKGGKASGAVDDAYLRSRLRERAKDWRERAETYGVSASLMHRCGGACEALQHTALQLFHVHFHSLTTRRIGLMAAQAGHLSSGPGVSAQHSHAHYPWESRDRATHVRGRALQIVYVLCSGCPVISA